jgi:glycine/D-amino acid oxidase-like deaminating enzyme
VRVEQVVTRPRGLVEEVTGVRTDAGDVECDVVVNCAGMWARELAERNGVVIPNQAAEHYYLITEPIDGSEPDAPVFEDPPPTATTARRAAASWSGSSSRRRRLAGRRHPTRLLLR